MLSLVVAGSLVLQLIAARGGAVDRSPQTPTAPAPEVIADVRVHGNHVTSDDEVVKIAGVAPGQPFTASTIADVTERLRASKKFDDVSVLKRFASISDPSQILVVIIVNEGPVRIELPGVPGGQVRVVKRTGLRNLMYLPILSGEDGYGLTYGVRVAWPGLVGQNSRLSFPLSWGGLKQAGAEFDRTFTQGPFTRVEGGGSLQSQHNPAYDTDDDRHRVWGRVERGMRSVRVAGQGAWEHVSFLDARDVVKSFDGEIVFDTRVDPLLPRDAVYARATVGRVYVGGEPGTTRADLVATGYLGLIRQTILVANVERRAASAPLPPYLKPLLGGNSNLRGFEAGSFVGDTVVTGSLEVRVPLTSPLSIGKLGVSVFADTGKAYDYGERFSGEPYHTGVGASVWVVATAFQVSLAVAHGLGASTRVNFGIGLTF